MFRARFKLTHYRAGERRVFGEVGRGTFGPITAEPCAGLAFVPLRIDTFAESGSLAASNGASNIDNVGHSTLARAATSYLMPNGMVLTPRVSTA